jgi:hypothetical protein
VISGRVFLLTGAVISSLSSRWAYSQAPRNEQDRVDRECEPNLYGSIFLAAGPIVMHKITGDQGNYRICPADRCFQKYINEYTLDLYPDTLKRGMRSIIVRSVGH